MATQAQYNEDIDMNNIRHFDGHLHDTICSSCEPGCTYLPRDTANKILKIIEQLKDARKNQQQEGVMFVNPNQPFWYFDAETKRADQLLDVHALEETLVKELIFT